MPHQFADGINLVVCPSINWCSYKSDLSPFSSPESAQFLFYCLQSPLYLFQSNYFMSGHALSQALAPGPIHPSLPYVLQAD